MSLSDELKSEIDRLVAQPAIDPATLRSQIEAHMARAQEELADRAFTDASLATRLGKACLALLDVPGLSADQQKLVQAACRYYVEDDDEDGDFSSMIGFEDDALLFNHVAQELGQGALAVAIED